MNGRTPGTIDQQSRDIAGFVHTDAGNVCEQTGEEFSTEFLRDRGALRMIILEENLPQRLRFQVNQNPENIYQNQNSNQDLMHHDLEHDAPGLFSPTVYREVGDNSANAGKVTKNHGEFYHSEGKPGGLYQDLSSDQIVFDQIGSPRYAAWPLGFNQLYEVGGKMKFLCSYGGRILPRPVDGKLRYVGGETRIMSISKSINWDELMEKTLAVCNQSHTIKYQLPGEDLDALISVCSNEDLHHMIEEYHELERKEGSERLRLFLIASGEADSPCSFEAKTQLQSDADHQYVFAVNGMFDSPRKNSGESKTPFGTILDCGLDSPASTSPKSSNLGIKQKSPAHVLNPPPIQGNTFHLPNHLSPILVQQTAPENSNKRCSGDLPCFYKNEKDMFAMDKSYCPNTSPYSNNLLDGPLSLMPHHNHQDSSEQTSKSPGTQYHVRSPSAGVLPCVLRDQIDNRFDIPTLKERAVSDSQLCEYRSGLGFGSEEAIMPLSPQKNRGEKSPSLAMLKNSSKELPILPHNKIDEKQHMANYMDQCTLNTLEDGLSPGVSTWMDISNVHSETSGKQPEGNNKVIENEYSIRYKNINNTTYLQSMYSHPHGVQEPNNMVSTSPLIDLSNFASVVKDDPCKKPIEVAHDMLVTKTLNDTNNEPPQTMIEEIVQPNYQGLYRHLDFSSQGSSDVEHKFVPSSLSCVKVSIPCEVKKVSIGRQPHNSNEMNNCLQAAQDPYNSHLSNKFQNLAIVVEDVTGCMPSDISLSSGISPHIEEAPTDCSASHRDSDSESIDQALQSQNHCNNILNEPVNGVGMTNLGVNIYGLQIIKNADIEELRELGSGTYGTVYHGKWRGTDVAIKRIKKSLFSNESPEQERLTKDFWREAQILSNLHHPNIVAFYGVALDGPGGTMATVTEYMVDGSSRHVLQRRIKALDRRKKLMIALDAAVGMEYLHLKRIVHFDLKCENLLVNLRDPQRPICKVGDFGLSRIKCDTLVSGSVRGTLPWMAPELLDNNGKGVTEKVDVYSFGVVMWEILTGKEPYANMHFGAIISGIVKNTLRPPIPNRCDSEWRRLMEECWSFDPAKRPSFTEIRNRLLEMSTTLQSKRNQLPNR